jgi:hypothetical protein
MDLNGFNKITLPNYFKMLPAGTEYKGAKRFEQSKTTEPPKDSRYPAYAGMMGGGHFITDYRPHCNYNLPPGSQFTTKQWMVNHTDSIINLSRQRTAEWTGASLPMAKTAPPPAQYVYSSPFENELLTTNYPMGLGVERQGAAAAPLFGTYVLPSTATERQANVKNISLTKQGSGGRNTRRGADAYIPS